MTQQELVADICNDLIVDREISSRSWRHLIIVVMFQREAATIQIKGFTYQEDGKATPTAPRTPNFWKKFVALRELSCSQGKEMWQACMVTIDSKTKKTSVDFEYDHPEKWLINPANVKIMAETLKPK